MDDLTDHDLDPRDAIGRLEARIATLEAKVESCRKFEAAARLALALGGVLLIALLLSLVPFDPLSFLGAIAALLGGVVMLGSNSSTRKQTQAELAAAEAQRTTLIGAIDLRVVRGGEPLH